MRRAGSASARICRRAFSCNGRSGSRARAIDSKLPALANFSTYKGELRALSFSDDPWATRPAVELLCSGFTAIEPEVLTVRPSDVGAKAIGHFGFFRPDHRDTLWRGTAEWIQDE